MLLEESNDLWVVHLLGQFTRTHILHVLDVLVGSPEEKEEDYLRMALLNRIVQSRVSEVVLVVNEDLHVQQNLGELVLPEFHSLN